MQIKELYKKFLKAKGAEPKHRNLVTGKKIDVSKKGLWDKKKKQVIVPSNRITMKGPNGEQDFFKKPVVATGLQSGQKVIMQPGGEYYFPNDKAVHEVRMQDGGLFAVGDYDKTLAPKKGNYLLPDINRPSYVDEEGGRRSEYKMGVNIDGKETLIPTVVNGKQLSEDEAVDRYRKTGLHMGQFNTPEEADYAARLRTAKYNMLEDPVRFQANQFSNGGMAEINPNTLGFQDGGSIQTDITTPVKQKTSEAQDAFNAMLDKYEASKSSPEGDASSPEDMGFQSGGDVPVVIDALFSNYQNGIGKKYAQQGMYVPGSIRIGDNPSTSDNTRVAPQFVDKAKIAQNQQRIAYAQTPEGKAELAATKKRVEADLLKKEQARIQREKEAKQRKLAEMQARIDDSKKVQDLPIAEQFTPDNLVRGTQAMGDKLRLFGPESPLVTSGLVEADPDSFYDEYLNPAKMLGDMGTDLAVGTRDAIKTGSVKPLLAPVATPLLFGAMGAIGSTGKKAKALDKIPTTQFNRVAPRSSSVYTPSMMPNIRRVANESLTTPTNLAQQDIVRELTPEQLNSILRRGTIQETVDAAEAKAATSARQKAKQELYDYSQVPQFDPVDLETAINKNLEKGYGIVSPEFQGTPLRVKLQVNPNDPHNIGILPKYGDNTLGVVEFQQNLRPYWKGSQEGFTEFNKTPGFRKTNDFPYGKVPPETIGPKGTPKYPGLNLGDKSLYQQDFYGSGISGELNKAINEAMKERKLGNILSGGTGHTLEGKARWDKLVEKGKAVKFGEEDYKLLKRGGNVDHSNDDDMVNGVASILRRVKDKDNRASLANQLSKQFNREKVNYNLSDFLNKSKVK